MAFVLSLLVLLLLLLSPANPAVEAALPRHRPIPVTRGGFQRSPGAASPMTSTARRSRRVSGGHFKAAAALPGPRTPAGDGGPILADGQCPLSLRQRLRLAQGAAEGLAYLHGFETPIIHRDIKPANILVTANMHAKVADFGLLNLLTHGEADATRVAGAPGYVDPDYRCTNIITAKSDVYSFGIVLLSLLTGQPPCIEETHIRIWAEQLLADYNYQALKDDKLVASEAAVLGLADLALDCLKSPGVRRPDMKDVAYRLSGLIEKHCPEVEEEWEAAEKAGKAGLASVDSDAQGGAPLPDFPDEDSALWGESDVSGKSAVIRGSQALPKDSNISSRSSVGLGSMLQGVGNWLKLGSGGVR